jgi:hypothetical protein
MFIGVRKKKKRLSNIKLHSKLCNFLHRGVTNILVKILTLNLRVVLMGVKLGVWHYENSVAEPNIFHIRALKHN